MKVCLLYKDREPGREETYHDPESIIQDLGLKSLFLVAAKEVIYDKGEVKKLEKQDSFLMDPLQNVMMVPLKTKEEIEFRQEILKDCLKDPELIRELYQISTKVQQKADDGQGAQSKRSGSPIMNLISDIERVQRFCDALARIRDMLLAREDLESEGFCAFRDTLAHDFSKEREQNIRKLLEDISFYTDRVTVKEDERQMLVRPKIVMECSLTDGLKLGPMKIEEVSSQSTKYHKRGGRLEKLQRFMESRIPDSFSTIEDRDIQQQILSFEFETVSYLMRKLKDFRDEFKFFFDRLKTQSAFYLGTVQLREHMTRFEMECCFPEVCDRKDLMFSDLKEFVMAIEQRVYVIGNTCSLQNKDLLIVTGANQGGKSTFLRSIGIALVMMQCGMPVTARAFKSGIFPRLFVHFTRREDSAMNSGRLDEELGRMNDIVEHIGDGSMVLLNESFATTTEKEGGRIAYDIIRALNEAGVHILTVTHLLSFAKRVYEETKDDPDSGVAFLCAERKEDGSRTFHMIPGSPEFTSFGLDLYEKIVEGNAG